MPRETIAMRKIKEILRLKLELGFSERQISGSCKVGKTTVSEYLRRARLAGLGIQQIRDLTDDELDEKLFPKNAADDQGKALPDWSILHRDRRKGVTLQLLWEEYRVIHPNDGYCYSHFCDLYHEFARTVDVTMRQNHLAGEKLFVDYAGQTIPIIDPKTGEIQPASIFIAVMGASNFTYAEASLSQQLPDWIGSHVRALGYIGGVPKAIVPDNLKSGVTKPWFYDPEINPTYAEFARHYSVAILPARVRKPRDKAKVESAVLFVQRWLLAQLRHQRFFSLAALNEAIRNLLERLNDRPFRKLPGSRRSLFETIDKPVLAGLPSVGYEYAHWKTAKVNIDYHVEYDHHYYSVPYVLVRKAVDVRATSKIIEIFHRGQRVASHLRSREQGKHTTQNEHMPPNHRWGDWDPQRLLDWASKIGPETTVVIQAMLSSRMYPEQGYRACLGVLRYAQKVGRDRLEAACARASALGSPRYRTVRLILEKGQDQLPMPGSAPETPLPTHDHIRGPQFYGGNDDAEPTNH